MAIAPVNRFISIAVPVAPGLQKLYEVPTGTSSLVLYAQVANVGVGTYPTVTFIQRRESRSTGLKRDIRVLKDIEIPPNDGVVLIDGRMVLEKTPTVLDRIYISGVQSGVSTVTDVTYDEPLGIATVTTIGDHGFSKGDQITMGGIAFTCANNNSGITTTIFPDPQASYTITKVIDTKKFVTTVGSANGITHFYNPAIHSFVRAGVNSITRDSTASKFTATGGSYIPQTGVLTLTISNHGMQDSSVTRDVDTADYDPKSGIMTVTSTGHPFTSNHVVKFVDNSLSFKCTMDGNTATKTYPRSTDPVSGVYKPISNVTTNTFEVNVGASPNVYYNATAVDFDTTAGIMTCTIGANNLKVGQSIRLATGSLDFSTGGGDVTYPESSNTTAYNTAVNITSVTTTTVTLDVGTAGVTGLYTFIPQVAKQPSTATYNASTGVMQLTINNHGLSNGDAIKIANNSITFSCPYGGATGDAAKKSYPRSTDPASNTFLRVSNVATNTFEVNVGDAGVASGSAHAFESATAGVTWSVIKSGSEDYAHTWVGDDGSGGAASNAIKASDETITIDRESLIFTCSQDGDNSEHGYPRTTDPAYNTPLAIIGATTNTISVDVGVSTSGGLVAPLQMEFLASILENNNA